MADRWSTCPSNLEQSNEAKTSIKWKSYIEEANRPRLCMSLLIALTIFILGSAKGLGGSTFLDLQIITNTDVEAASAFFTAHSVGFLIGSVLSGLISRKVNRSLTLLVGLLGTGACALVTPYCFLYVLMVSIRAADGTFAGLLDTTGNAEQMRLWGNEGRPLMQLIHFAFSIGGLLSPLYTEPFLAPQAMEDSIANLTSHQLNSSTKLGLAAASLDFAPYNISSGLDLFSSDESLLDSLLNASSRNITHGILHNNVSNMTHYTAHERVTNVHWAFIIMSIMAFCGSIPIAWMYFHFRDLTLSQKSPGPSQGNDVSFRKLPRRVHLGLICYSCTIFVCYACMEDTFVSFLMTFVVREFESVTKSQGAYITAIFWASSACARFVIVFVSQVLSPERILYLCGAFICLSFIGLPLSATFNSITALGVFVATSGIGLSAVMASAILWMESELLHVTGAVSSVIFVSSSLGKMVNPILLSFLMEEISNMWYSYMLIVYFTIMVSIFSSVLILNRYFLNKRFGFLRRSTGIYYTEAARGLY